MPSMNETSLMKSMCFFSFFSQRAASRCAKSVKHHLFITLEGDQRLAMTEQRQCKVSNNEDDKCYAGMIFCKFTDEWIAL